MNILEAKLVLRNDSPAPFHLCNFEKILSNARTSKIKFLPTSLNVLLHTMYSCRYRYIYCIVYTRNASLLIFQHNNINVSWLGVKIRKMKVDFLTGHMSKFRTSSRVSRGFASLEFYLFAYKF